MYLKLIDLQKKINKEYDLFFTEIEKTSINSDKTREIIMYKGIRCSIQDMGLTKSDIEELLLKENALSYLYCEFSKNENAYDWLWKKVVEHAILTQENLLIS